MSKRSIVGFILYVLGVQVTWQSKLQKSISLSSSEAVYPALSEAVNEVIFIMQLLRSKKIFVKHPVMVRVDNVDAILIASNITTTSCTKHVDIRYKYMNEYAEDEIVEMCLLSLLTITVTFSPKT